MDYIIYVSDIESTGLDSDKHDIIELSLLRLNDGAQKTWCLKPLNPDTIDPDALRVNGHKKEDLLHLTKEGKARYLEPSSVLVDIENWVLDDGYPHSNRVLAGQNINFDRDFMIKLWKKCASGDSFPFGRRYLDTMQIQFFFDWCQGKMEESYSLSSLIKKHGIKNEKAHTAEADTRATKELLEKQIEYFKKLLINAT
jgi:DNA polymerase III epsilon subunit-like protein